MGNTEGDSRDQINIRPLYKSGTMNIDLNPILCRELRNILRNTDKHLYVLQDIFDFHFVR